MDNLLSWLSSLFAYGTFLSGWARTHGVRIIIILFVAAFSYSVVRRFLDQSLQWQKGIEKSRRETMHAVLLVGLRVAIVLIVLLLVLPELGFTIGPLLASLGIFGLAISFGAQSLVKDLVSSFFLLAEDLCRVGEEIKVGTIRGRVESLRLRTLVIRDTQGALVFVPYGEIKDLVNYSRSNSASGRA